MKTILELSSILRGNSGGKPYRLVGLIKAKLEVVCWTEHIVYSTNVCMPAGKGGSRWGVPKNAPYHNRDILGTKCALWVSIRVFNVNTGGGYVTV